jgi:hypothetical protein
MTTGSDAKRLSLNVVGVDLIDPSVEQGVK